MPREGPSLGAWLAELKRRSVFRVAAAYAAVAFVLVQGADYVFDALLFPEWAHRLLVVFLLAGFPVALVLAWAFELTPEGLRPSSRLIGDDAEATDETGWLRPAAAFAVVGAVGLAVAGASWAAWNVWLSPEPPAAAEGAVAEGPREALAPTRVAVLYFDDHSEGQELGHVAKGLTEAVIHELTQVEELDVLSRNAVKPYRDPDLPLDSVVRHLGAGSVVEGSVTRTADRYEATIQLVDGETLAHLMSEVVEVSGEDPLELRDAIVREAVDLLRRRLGEEIRLEAIRSETESPDAWEHFHRADRLVQQESELWPAGDTETARRLAPRLLERADSLFAEAERADPTWPLPTISRGWTALRLASFSGPEIAGYDQASLQRGVDFANRVIDRRQDHPAAYELRGTARYTLSRVRETSESSDLLSEAEADLRTALELDPTRARTWLELGDLLRSRGRFPEARAALRRSQEADPFLGNDFEQLQILAQMAVELEEYETAQRLVREGQRRAPESVFFPVLELNIYASPGGPRVASDSAWRIITGMERRFERILPMGRMQVAAILARAGLRDSALSVVGHARAAAGQGDPMLDYYEALTRLILGEEDEALQLLSRYVEARPQRRSYVASESWWKPLREDPRFQEMVADTP